LKARKNQKRKYQPPRSLLLLPKNQLLKHQLNQLPSKWKRNLMKNLKRNPPRKPQLSLLLLLNQLLRPNQLRKLQLKNLMKIQMKMFHLLLNKSLRNQSLNQ